MMFFGECNVLTFTLQNLPLIAHEANFDNLLHAEIVQVDNVQYTPKKKRFKHQRHCYKGKKNYFLNYSIKALKC